MRTISQFIFRVCVIATTLAVASVAFCEQQFAHKAIAVSGAKPADMQSMPAGIGKFDSREVSDAIQAEGESMGVQEGEEPLAVSSKPLVGTWVNADSQTGGLSRVTIAAKGKEVTVLVLGACAPNPCDWGVSNGTVYALNVDSAPAVAFTARYTLSFEQVILVGHLVKGTLHIESFSHFTDDSGRSDYYRLDVMIR